MSPCNCGGGKGTTRPFSPSARRERESEENAQYILRTMKGTTVFGSRLEAEAALRREGGGSITRA